ncbi:M56 family metallopeptidase [Nonomuraea basaltis]|uniref:M56 family metallopeptidase n=1 Tax=Nonomuraea basaltis TaxID=2495887 RepID=UPI00110C6842|nr:M56 family metallopeptidase [Nonomuraea basaltis]TMR95749.1 M56 family peptidase [Nonomuraea basaltis]
MTVAIALAAYTALIAFGLPGLITRSKRLRAAPRLSIATWLAGCGSAVAAATLSGLQLAFPTHTIGDELAALVTACTDMLAGHPPPRTMRPVVVLAGLAVSGLAVIRLCYVMAAVLWTGWRDRRAHRAGLRLAGRVDARLGAVVVPHAEPGAYCVPGRRPTIVVTTGALGALDRRQLAAVLAHERAHVRGRHHLLLTAALVAARAFPRLPLFREAGSAVPHLVELLADDVAARRHDRRVIASALVTLVRATTPLTALGAGGATAVARVMRLLSPAPPARSRSDTVVGLACLGGLLAGPAFASLLPSLVTFLLSCPAFG